MSFRERAKSIATAPLLAGFDPEARASPNAPPDLAEYERRIFHDMLNRTTNIFNPCRFSSAKAREPKDTTRIVSVRSQLDIWSERELAFENFRDGTRLLRPKPKFPNKKWVDARLVELEATLALKPDIICFPEFSHPPPPRSPAGGWTLEEIDDAVGKRRDFGLQVRNLLEKYESDAFVFLGSYHCLMTLYNVGVIYPWGHEIDGWGKVTEREIVLTEEGFVEEREMSRRWQARAPISYRKRFPAQKMKEHTRVPSGREFNLFEREFGNVAVLICSDVLDLNQFMMLIRQGLDEFQGFDFILVPAYNAGSSFGPMCRDLSYLSATTVVFTNAEDPDITLSAPEVYVCGVPSTQLSKAASRELRNLFKVTEVTFPSGGSMRTYDFDRVKLQHARRMHLARLRGGHRDGGDSSTDLSKLPI